MNDFTWLDEVIAGAMERARKRFPLEEHCATLATFGVSDATEFWGEIAWAAEGAWHTSSIDRATKMPAPSRLAGQLRNMAAQMDSAWRFAAQLDEMEAVAVALADLERVRTFCQIQETLMSSLSGGTGVFDADRAGEFRIRIAEWQADTQALSDGLKFAADLVAARSEGTRGSGASQKYLRSFVPRLADIWERMTGRPATAERIARKNRTSLPDFVLFVRYIADMAGVTPPTASMVKTEISHRKAALSATA